jgi:hypothetical protein
MFAVFEASSAGAKQLVHSALMMYSETKLDAATGLLFGRAAAMVRATPPEIATYVINYDSRHIQSNSDPAVFSRDEAVEHVNAHQTIIFNRCKVTGLSDRTFNPSSVGCADTFSRKGRRLGPLQNAPAGVGAYCPPLR